MSAVAAPEPRLLRELKRLLADWQRSGDAAARKSLDRSLSTAERRVLAMQARVQGACIADIRELIEGRPNPCDRR